MLRSGGLLFLCWGERKRIDLELQGKQQWIQSQSCSRLSPSWGRCRKLPPPLAAKTEDIPQVSGQKKSLRSALRHTSPSLGLKGRAHMPKTCLFFKLDSLVYLLVWSGTVSKGQCGSSYTQAGGIPKQTREFILDLLVLGLFIYLSIFKTFWKKETTLIPFPV